MPLFGIYNASLKNILVNAIVQKRLEKYAAQYFKGKLIDIGCGLKPYEQVLSPFVKEHVGLDHHDSFHNAAKVDIFGTAYKIPVASKTFDSALCSAVLEHLEEPEMALKECYRVLKNNGFAIYSIPFIWHLHEEPRDFYRYSKYGIKHLFEKAGFELVTIDPLSGFWVTFGQLLVYYIYRFNRGPLRWFKIITLIGIIIQAIVFLINKIDKTHEWTWMYLVIAKKT